MPIKYRQHQSQPMKTTRELMNTAWHTQDLVRMIKQSRVIYYSCERGRGESSYIQLYVILDNEPFRISYKATACCGLSWHEGKGAITSRGGNTDLGMDIIEKVCETLNLEFNYRSTYYSSPRREEGEITAQRWP